MKLDVKGRFHALIEIQLEIKVRFDAHLTLSLHMKRSLLRMPSRNSSIDVKTRS
jgi:hypothetical protein